jgi:hypothetical protein
MQYNTTQQPTAVATLQQGENARPHGLLPFVLYSVL